MASVHQFSGLWCPKGAESGQKGYPKGVYFKEKCHVALPAKVSKNDGGLSEIEGSGSSKPSFFVFGGSPKQVQNRDRAFDRPGGNFSVIWSDLRACQGGSWGAKWALKVDFKGFEDDSKKT